MQVKCTCFYQPFHYLYSTFYFLYYTIMKNLLFLLCFTLPLVLIAGCGSSSEKNNPTEGEFAAASCNQYVAFTECLITASVPEDQQADVRDLLDATKEQRKTLSTEEQETQCSTALEPYRADPEAYAAYGCSIE
jgi:hypothetical protein